MKQPLTIMKSTKRLTVPKIVSLETERRSRPCSNDINRIITAQDQTLPFTPNLDFPFLKIDGLVNSFSQPVPLDCTLSTFSPRATNSFILPSNTTSEAR